MDKNAVVLYAYYEMISSYFKSYEVANKYVEKSLYLYFMDAKDKFQEECEDYCIYGIEHILPSFIGDYNLEEYNALISIDKQNNLLHIKTEAFQFDVIAAYEKDKPSLIYKNIQIRENGRWKDFSKKQESFKKNDNSKKFIKKNTITGWRADDDKTSEKPKSSIVKVIRTENSKCSKKKNYKSNKK